MKFDPYFPLAVWYLWIWARILVIGQFCHFGEDKFLEVGIDLVKDFNIAAPDSEALVISVKSGAKKGTLNFQSV